MTTSSPLPSLAQAEAYLAEGERLNPGPWVAHSRFTGEAAARIAAAWPGLDPDKARILGMLHDIGRRAGVHGMRHIMDGYRFLMAEGYPAPARICLTHSFPDPALFAAMYHWDGSPADLDFISQFLTTTSLDDYDRLMVLCDVVSMPEGFVLMEKRMVDVALRYGANELTAPRWKAFFAVKDYVEAAIHQSVYRLLPNVVETTFGF